MSSRVLSAWTVTRARPPGRSTRRSSISQAVSKASIWVNTEKAETRSRLASGSGRVGIEMEREGVPVRAPVALPMFARRRQHLELALFVRVERDGIFPDFHALLRFAAPDGQCGAPPANPRVFWVLRIPVTSR